MNGMMRMMGRGSIPDRRYLLQPRGGTSRLIKRTRFSSSDSYVPTNKESVFLRIFYGRKTTASISARSELNTHLLPSSNQTDYGRERRYFGHDGIELEGQFALGSGLRFA